MKLKFLLDAHLPVSLIQYFNGHDVIHVSQLEAGNLTSDKTINEISITENRIVITKDTDFYYSYLANKAPFKLILVKLGNVRLTDLKTYFAQNAARIITTMKDHSFVILEQDKIRVLE